MAGLPMTKGVDFSGSVKMSDALSVFSGGDIDLRFRGFICKLLMTGEMFLGVVLAMVVRRDTLEDLGV